MNKRKKYLQYVIDCRIHHAMKALSELARKYLQMAGVNHHASAFECVKNKITLSGAQSILQIRNISDDIINKEKSSGSNIL